MVSRKRRLSLIEIPNIKIFDKRVASKMISHSRVCYEKMPYEFRYTRQYPAGGSTRSMRPTFDMCQVDGFVSWMTPTFSAGESREERCPMSELRDCTLVRYHEASSGHHRHQNSIHLIPLIGNLNLHMFQVAVESPQTRTPIKSGSVVRRAHIQCHELGSFKI